MLLHPYLQGIKIFFNLIHIHKSVFFFFLNKHSVLLALK